MLFLFVLYSMISTKLLILYKSKMTIYQKEPICGAGEKPEDGDGKIKL